MLQPVHNLAAPPPYEESLRQSEERFRLLVEAVLDYAIFLLDSNGYVMTWNTGAQRIKGYREEEIVGRHFSRFYPPDAIRSGWPDYELQVAGERGRFEDEGWRIRKDGSRFWANVIITALRGADGQLRGFAKVTRDLTERKRAEELLADGEHRDQLLEAERNARMEAQRAVRMKDEFLATLSHELRTPLNAILGWTQILRRQSAKTVDVDRGMEAIERNARAQVMLIDELLDLSRIISGRIRLDMQRVRMSEIVRGAIESIEPTAHTKGIRLESALDPGAAPVSGDPTRLQQVAWNLVSNAIKFTPSGGTVQVQLKQINAQIELTVRDTGIGIPADFLPHVFDRFSQKDSSSTRTHGGLGLGLAISKQLVELHGGTLTAESEGEGHGATFTVALPGTTLSDYVEPAWLQPSHPSLSDPQTALPSIAGARALVIDDEDDARDLVQRVLEERGATVTTASSGEEAAALLAAIDTDIILCDIGMPGMDGYQLMRALRSSASNSRRIPAIALTAFARPEDRKKAILAGYQSHLSKPFDIAELVIVVAGLLGRTG